MQLFTEKDVPKTSAFIVTMLGLINILSGIYPALPLRFALLRELLPLHFIQGAQMLAIFFGFMLVILANGLRNRRKRALQLVIILLVCEIGLNIVKGLDFEEAFAGGVMIIWLYIYRSEFSIQSPLPSTKKAFEMIALSIGLYYGYIISGFIVLQHHIVPRISLWNMLIEPFRILFTAPYYTYISRQSHWFSQSEVLIGIALVFFAIVQLITPLFPNNSASTEDIAKARSILKKYGTDTLSYFSMQHNRRYFFDSTGQSFVSYRISRGAAVVGADPIGNPHTILSLLTEFSVFMQEEGIKVSFLGVSDSYLSSFKALGYHAIKLGEEAVIDLQSFDSKTLKKKVRRAVRHIEESGITITIQRRDSIREEDIDVLEQISKQWTANRGGRQSGYSMTLQRLPEYTSDNTCELVIARKGNTIQGYLCMVPVYATNSWSLDGMKRTDHAPNGITESMIIAAAQEYKRRGCNELSLNFSTFANSNKSASRLFSYINNGLFLSLSQIYQLKSLYTFNSKFNPEWRDRYLVYPDPVSLPHITLAAMKCEQLLRI